MIFSIFSSKNTKKVTKPSHEENTKNGSWVLMEENEDIEIARREFVSSMKFLLNEQKLAKGDDKFHYMIEIYEYLYLNLSEDPVMFKMLIEYPDNNKFFKTIYSKSKEIRNDLETMFHLKNDDKDQLYFFMNEVDKIIEPFLFPKGNL